MFACAFRSNACVFLIPFTAVLRVSQDGNRVFVHALQFIRIRKTDLWRRRRKETKSVFVRAHVRLVFPLLLTRHVQSKRPGFLIDCFLSDANRMKWKHLVTQKFEAPLRTGPIVESFSSAK